MRLSAVFPPHPDYDPAAAPAKAHVLPLRVTHEVDLDLCLHCTTHAKPEPRKARKRGGWCRKCREYHADPRKRGPNRELRCPVCTLKPSD